MSEKGSTNRDPSRRETLVRGALMAAIGMRPRKES